MGRATIILYGTVGALVYSYLAGLYFKPVNHVKTDCSIFPGDGLDQNGNKFKEFEDFYPYYICEHTKPRTKLFHFVSTTNLLLLLLSMWLSSTFSFGTLILGIVQAYGLAWISHFYIEMNKPATWQYPLLSFLGDLKMFTELASGEYVLWE